jgi:hypothetical protein
VRAGLDDLLPIALPILIDHLRDNAIREDAWRSQHAMKELGRNALPWLEPFRDSEDAQQRDKVRRIIEQIRRRPDGDPPSAASYP